MDTPDAPKDKQTKQLEYIANQLKQALQRLHSAAIKLHTERIDRGKVRPGNIFSKN